jgi:hypothetical protein
MSAQKQAGLRNETQQKSNGQILLGSTQPNNASKTKSCKG